MPHSKIHDSALLSLGFRPFFIGAAIHAIAAVGLWMAIFVFNQAPPFPHLSAFQWHAHEMIYGYSLAVIAGFLLTAVGNWTGLRMPHGYALLALFSLWAAARLIYLTGVVSLDIAGILDMLFMLALIWAVATPCIRKRQWKQMAIVAKLLFLAAGNLLFYLGASGSLTDGIHWGNYGGLYLVIGLILTMARRVVPFFIERGVDYPVTLRNSKWLDIASMVLFLGFFVSEVFTRTHLISGWLAVGLLAVNGVRLAWWHTPGIWKVPLLWSLYVALVFISLGFALFALGVFGTIPVSSSIHAFAFGGIGLITLGMMSRVSLGHTGRDVRSSPRGLGMVFLLLLTGALLRVLLPIVDSGHYLVWIAASQVFWISAFSLFALLYFPLLSRPGLDQKPA